jgi:hypothetical protein
MNTIARDPTEDTENAFFNRGILRDLNEAFPNFLLHGPDLGVTNFALLNPELTQISQLMNTFPD